MSLGRREPYTRLTSASYPSDTALYLLALTSALSNPGTRLPLTHVKNPQPPAIYDLTVLIIPLA